jgi:choline dehydrogenase-like flavoprotein
MMNIGSDPLSLSDADAQALVNTAGYHLAVGWSPHNEEIWAHTFNRLRIDDFKQLERVSGDKDFWKPLLCLSVVMHVDPYNKGFKDELSAARSNMESLVRAWHEINGQPMVSIPEFISDNKEIRKILSKRKRESKKADKLKTKQEKTNNRAFKTQTSLWPD